MRHSKYNAVKTKIDGITFASKMEAARYGELKLLLKAGKIKDLVLQPTYILDEKLEKNERKYRAVVYKADFKYYDVEKNKEVIEDVKGHKTKVYKLKKRWFDRVYPDKTITEIEEERKAYKTFR